MRMMEKERNPNCVAKMVKRLGVIGNHQRFKGYTLFLCKKHVSELHHLEHKYKMKFLEEMSLVAQDVQKAFNAEKMNYELLGNGDSHGKGQYFKLNLTKNCLSCG